MFEGFVLLFMIAILVVITAKKSGKTVYMGTQKELDAKAEITTICPIPLQAATCHHDWDAITDKTLDMPHEKKQILVLQCRNCGMLDKTIATTSPVKAESPKPCQHTWEVQHNQSLEMSHEKKVVVLMTCKLCGKIDKTVETTGKFSPKSECRHKWVNDEKVVLESAYEQMLKSISKSPQGYQKNPEKKLDLDLGEAPKWMFKKCYICLKTCSVCGEVNKTVAYNFEENEE